MSVPRRFEQSAHKAFTQSPHRARNTPNEIQGKIQMCFLRKPCCFFSKDLDFWGLIIFPVELAQDGQPYLTLHVSELNQHYHPEPDGSGGFVNVADTPETIDYKSTYARRSALRSQTEMGIPSTFGSYIEGVLFEGGDATGFEWDVIQNTPTVLEFQYHNKNGLGPVDPSTGLGSAPFNGGHVFMTLEDPYTQEAIYEDLKLLMDQMDIDAQAYSDGIDNYLWTYDGGGVPQLGSNDFPATLLGASGQAVIPGPTNQLDPPCTIFENIVDPIRVASPAGDWFFTDSISGLPPRYGHFNTGWFAAGFLNRIDAKIDSGAWPDPIPFRPGTPPSPATPYYICGNIHQMWWPVLVRSRWKTRVPVPVVLLADLSAPTDPRLSSLLDNADDRLDHPPFTPTNVPEAGDDTYYGARGPVWNQFDISLAGELKLNYDTSTGMAGTKALQKIYLPMLSRNTAPIWAANLTGFGVAGERVPWSNFPLPP